MRAGELSGLRGKPQAGCVAFHAHDAQMFVAKGPQIHSLLHTCWVLASRLAPTAVGAGRHTWADML